ncbi:MAG: hypothetical protein JW751_28255 [Polyangiaceae bacterium]|nr:hypothetical protein [Polyangiaceae bacterium]
MRRLALLGYGLLLGMGAGCANSDGDSTALNGGAENGGAANGGAPTGGATTGGNPSGGRATGGATTGGTASGGASGHSTTGGATSGGASAGAATGGAATGGDPSGGATSGGTTTGGAPSGGHTSGGAPPAGAESGGAPAAGAESGGAPTAGAESGGAPTAGAESGGDGGAAAGATGGGAAGFHIRIPETRTVECDDGSEATFADADTLCTFSDGPITGEIYIQASAVSCRVLGSALPTYEGFAQIMIDGAVTSLSGALYSSGGNHNNDSFDFTYGDSTYRYWHSSFNVGGRRCQPMDCAMLITRIGAYGDEILDDGCTCERTRPIVCSEIRADGTYASIDVDRFEVCPYDPLCGG